MGVALNEITLGLLCDEGLMAPSTEPSCVFMSGSMVEGWNHAKSDIDIYVVTESPADVAATEVALRVLDPPSVPMVIHFAGEVRWDVEYWLERQVKQVLDKVIATDLDGERTAGFDLTLDDRDFLYRLAIGRPIVGAEWLRLRQQALEQAKYPTIIASSAFNDADSFIEDALGQLEADDDVSAVLAARLAFGTVLDGLLATKGELSPNPKWRAQKMRRRAPAEITWDEYWAIETMRDFDPQSPARWVRRVIERCHELMLEVDLS